MAEGMDSGGRDQGPGEGTVELRITVTGTHTRRDDLRALRTWLEDASAVHEARADGKLEVGRKDSLTQTEAMGGELVQDIIFWASTEAARSLVSRTWPSVDTWIRNRRRFADPGENPRVTLDGPETGPGSDLRRDTDSEADSDSDSGRDGDRGRDRDGDAGHRGDPGRSGNAGRSGDAGHGGDADRDADPGTRSEPGEPNRTHGDEPGEV